MNTTKNHVLHKIPMLLACAFIPFGASASLYVSPVTKESSTVNYASNLISAPSAYGNSSASHLMQTGGSGNVFELAMLQDDAQQEPSVQRGYGISVDNNKPTVLMNKGMDIPLFIAIESIVPDLESWSVNYDKGIHKIDVSWEGGNTWEGVLQSLANQNSLFVEINHAERVVGIARDGHISKHLAKKLPTVWRVDTSKSLRENLTEWTEKAGWSLAWEDSLMIDYPVNHDAVFTGNLAGEGGSIDQILLSYRHADVPLKAKFFKKNKVVLVTRGGFEQELSY